MQLLDKYLSTFNYNAPYQKVVNASIEKCFFAAKDLDMKRSFIATTLMKLRGLPVKDLTLQGFIKNMCFKYAAENPCQEFLIDASRKGIKVFWNFSFTEIEKNKTLVSTETRILCLTKRSQFSFSIYWFFIKPFSGLTRKEMLRLIKKDAEQRN